MNLYTTFDCGVQGNVGLSFKLAETLWLSTVVGYYNGFIAQNKYGSNNMMNRNLILNLSVRIGVGK